MRSPSKGFLYAVIAALSIGLLWGGSEMGDLNEEMERQVASAKRTSYTEGYDDGYAAGYEDGVVVPVKKSDSATAKASSGTSVKNSTSASVSSDVSNVTVYVTRTGSKYHLEGCSYLKSKIEMTLEDALQKGYDSCSRCDPPEW